MAKGNISDHHTPTFAAIQITLRTFHSNKWTVPLWELGRWTIYNALIWRYVTTGKI